MTRTKLGTMMVMTAVAVVIGAQPASAVAVYDDAAVVATTPDPKAKAHELWLEAEALFSQPKQWRKAVRLLEQSARLRGPDDPEAFTCLMYAGHLRTALGDVSGARVVLERAAQHALQRGAIVEAAHAYIDAAHAAIAARAADDAEEMSEKARLLTVSPLLTTAQREGILTRLDG